MNTTHDLIHQKSIMTVGNRSSECIQLELTLGHAGYEVHGVSNDQEVYQLLQIFVPNLIIIDWEIAKINDAELIKRLKNIVHTEDIPIIVSIDILTPSIELQQAFQLGIADFIYSPIKHTELLMRIQIVLRVTESLSVLKQSNQTKNRLLAVVSHDLRSPLSSFQGMLAYLKAVGQEQLCMTEVYRLMMNVEEEFTTVVNMANSLLFWALNQEDAICFEKQPCALPLLLKQSIKIFSLQTKQKNVDVRLAVADDLTISSDINMLRFIIRNLLSNAIKFSPVNGKVYIEVSTQGNRLSISVADSGVGIEKEKLEHLFQHITTSKSSTDSYGKKGTGLGLAVAYDFAKKMGGSLFVVSELGKGSVFTLALPMEVPEVVSSL